VAANVNQQSFLDETENHEYGGKLEFWATPRWAVDAIVPILKHRMLGHSSRWSLLDPGCGNGAISSALVQSALGRLLSLKIGVELDSVRASEARLNLPDCTVTTGDFLEYRCPHVGSPLLVCGNPPYGKALEFVEHAISIASPSDGIVAMLLQLDFATGVKRAGLHDRHPSGLYPLRRRPNFGGQHSSGQRPFAWFLWDLFDSYSEWRVIG
jgi:predicted RNA methylase